VSYHFRLAPGVAAAFEQLKQVARGDVALVYRVLERAQGTGRETEQAEMIRDIIRERGS
jgi:hypothetical protein